jgi:hypothetical protein
MEETSMGYILPITQHQYIQYANRMLKTKKSPFVLPPVIKVSLEKKLKDNENREPLEFESIEENSAGVSYKARKTLTTATASLNYQLLSEITGKGRHINETI